MNDLWKWLTAVVAVHLLIAFAHGAAHNGAHVPLSTAATLFVFTVILGGPLAGLAVSRWSRRLGAGIILVTMAGSLVFGVVNHFLLESPDQVAHVDADWRVLFGSTAAALAVTELLAVSLAMRVTLKGLRS